MKTLSKKEQLKEFLSQKGIHEIIEEGLDSLVNQIDEIYNKDFENLKTPQVEEIINEHGQVSEKKFTYRGTKLVLKKWMKFWTVYLDGKLMPEPYTIRFSSTVKGCTMVRNGEVLLSAGDEVEIMINKINNDLNR